MRFEFAVGALFTVLAGFLFVVTLGFIVNFRYEIRKEDRKQKAFESCLQYRPAHMCYDGKILVDR